MEGTKLNAEAVLHTTENIIKWTRSIDSPATERALELAVLLEAPDRAPLPNDAPGAGKDTDAAFVRRVVSKLKCELRYYPRDWTPEQTLERFRRDVKKFCRLVARDREGRYDHPTPTLADPSDLDCLAGTSGKPRSSSEEADPDWWKPFVEMVPSPLSSLAVLMASCIESALDFELLLNATGTLDVTRFCDRVGVDSREVREVLACLRKEARKVKSVVPRCFRNVYEQLTQLVDASLEGLPDVELREKLFDISRDLAYSFSTSFGPDDVIAPGARRLRKTDLVEVIDLLLEDHKSTEESSQRTRLERLMDSTMRVCDALEAADLDRAFAYSALLVRDAASLQHHLSPSRLQVLRSYAYLLWLGGLRDESMQMNQKITNRCNAIVREQGAAVLDYPPEFEHGETLRRVRTLAGLNLISCLFNHIYSQPQRQRYRVRDYQGLAGLAPRLHELIRYDPEASAVYDELLVVLAHLAYVAKQKLERHAQEPGDRQHWKDQHARWRAESRTLLETHYFTSDVPKLNAQAVVKAIQDAGEGYAVERAIGVVKHLLRDQPQVVTEIRAEREAALIPPIS